MSKAESMKKWLKKYWITIWLIASVVSLCGILTYAKFNDGENYSKRVIATGTNDKTMFTSNLLTTINTKHFSTVAPLYSYDTEFDFNIYNYDRTKPTSFYPNTINYMLTATLMKADETTVYNLSNAADVSKLSSVLGSKTLDVYRLVNGTPENDPILSVSASKISDNISAEQLIPDEDSGSATNSYRIVIPKEAIDSEIYLKITAEPIGYIDLPPFIGGFFYVQSQNVIVTTGWKGSFIDNHSISPSNYDAFNYRISGGGVATKVLKWNSNYVQPNKYELMDLFNVVLTASMSQITITFPLSDNGNMYDIQFYVKDEAARSYISGLTWAELEAAGIVTLEDAP